MYIDKKGDKICVSAYDKISGSRKNNILLKRYFFGNSAFSIFMFSNNWEKTMTDKQSVSMKHSKCNNFTDNHQWNLVAMALCHYQYDRASTRCSIRFIIYLNNNNVTSTSVTSMMTAYDCGIVMWRDSHLKKHSAPRQNCRTSTSPKQK